MFWGLIVQPNKKYSKTVNQPFHVSQAVLDLNSNTESDVQLIVKSDELEYILCVLNKSKTVQVPLDLIFSKGDNIAFRSVGGTVHLTGYLVDDEDYCGMGEADSSEGEEDIPDLVPAKGLEHEDSAESPDEASDDEADGDSDAEESEEESTKPPPAKIQKMQKMNGMANGQSKRQEKQKESKQKKQKHQQTTEKTVKASPSGLKIEDLRVGQGAVAKLGRKIQVYYEGRFKSNNKVFDKANTGKGFEFILGKSDVIKGWDIGLQGMKIGGKRRIVCPPHMAYGSKGSPPAIPPNSTLVFEVVLRAVN